MDLPDCIFSSELFFVGYYFAQPFTRKQAREALLVLHIFATVSVLADCSASLLFISAAGWRLAALSVQGA